MNKSDTINELATALALVQGQLKRAEETGKAHHGKYADLGDVWDACRNLLDMNGLAVLQFPGRYDAEQKTMELETVVTHTSGQYMSHTLTIPVAKPNPQGMGSSITYARRYALSSVLGIVTGARRVGWLYL